MVLGRGWEGQSSTPVLGSEDDLCERFCTGSLLDDTYAQLFLSLARCIQEESERVSKQIQYMNAKVNPDVLAKLRSPRSMDVWNF